VLGDPGIDAVIVLFVPPVVAGAAEVAAGITRALEQAPPTQKPVLASLISADGTPAALESSRVTAFAYPESAARALGRAAARADWLRRPLGDVPDLDGIDLAAAERIVAGAVERWLGTEETRALLGAFGVPLVPERLAESVEEAVEAAKALGFPAVVKTAEAGAHKTESGGVALDLRDADAVRAAVERIGVPVIVQPLVRGGAELLVGAFQDPVFGPLVALGPGGTLAELIGDASFRLAPLTDVDAEELVRGGKAGRLVAGYRGAPPADEAALVDLVLRIGRLAEQLPGVAELDLNPVIALPDGCAAVDARVRVGAPPVTRAPKTW
jgi:acyl-CoA synthetase (NDP forming)